MGRLHLSDQLLFATTLLPCSNHDRRSMRIVGTDKDTLATDELLKSHPYVGLNMLDHMADMDVPIGIRQCRRHKDPFLTALGITHGLDLPIFFRPLFKPVHRDCFDD
jgi:hypothetical protein